ncbi:MAG: hypothetical protein F4X97_11335 [Boseongicola sp. SB0662_bin_57]|nr:hypothetical protein [Boseongicola sp. SB0662_bin_57]
MEIALEACEFLDLEPEVARAYVSGAAKRIRETWKEALKKEGASAEEVKQYADAFEHDDSEKALQWHEWRRHIQRNEIGFVPLAAQHTGCCVPTRIAQGWIDCRTERARPDQSRVSREAGTELPRVVSGSDFSTDLNGLIFKADLN